MVRSAENLYFLLENFRTVDIHAKATSSKTRVFIEILFIYKTNNTRWVKKKREHTELISVKKQLRK